MFYPLDTLSTTPRFFATLATRQSIFDEDYNAPLKLSPGEGIQCTFTNLIVWNYKPHLTVKNHIPCFVVEKLSMYRLKSV